jgi:hypothetical protein
MTKISRADIAIDRSVKRRVALPPEVDADLQAYARLLSTDGEMVDPADLIVTMIERFMAGDRQFRQARRMERGARRRKPEGPGEGVATGAGTGADTTNGHPGNQDKA